MTDETLELTYRSVTNETWTDFEALFSSRGAPKYCWCTVWRGSAAEIRGMTNAAKRDSMRKRVDDNVPVGLVAYHLAVPIGWCSVGPRESFRTGMARLDSTEGTVWSATCFFVTREYRSKGVMRGLIEAAKDYARSGGADVLEAYPVDPASPSYRFGGFVDAFERAGFAEFGRAGTRRYIFRFSLANRTPVEPS